MKTFKELQEAVKSKDGIVWTFGRFNPPTTGHELVMNKVLTLAKKYNYDNMIYTSQSQDKKKNPLSWKDKVSILDKMFPKVNISKEGKIKTPFDVLDSLYEKDYKNVIMIVGSDRVKEFELRMAKYVTDFDSFQVVSAGVRDEASTGVSGISGSKMREYAKNNDFIMFKKGLPKTYKDAHKLFQKLQKEMQ